MTTKEEIALWEQYKQDGCCSTCRSGHRMDWENPRYTEGDYRCSFKLDFGKCRWNETCRHYKQGVPMSDPEHIPIRDSSREITGWTNAVENAEIHEDFIAECLEEIRNG